MAFVKGVSGNQRGKVPGTLNKRTIAHTNRVQEMIAAIEAHPKWADMLDNMSHKEMKDLWKDLLEYDMPKLARQEHTDGDGGPLIIRVLHSPAPAVLPTPALVEDAVYAPEIKSLPKSALKPF